MYARSLSDAPAGGLQLLRVASWPPSSSGVLSLLSGLSSEEDSIVLRTVSRLCCVLWCTCTACRQAAVHTAARRAASCCAR